MSVADLEFMKRVRGCLLKTSGVGMHTSQAAEEV